MKIVASALVASALLLPSQASNADDSSNRASFGGMAIAAIPAIAEPVIPDLRYEFGDGESSWVLSFPIAWHVGNWRYGDYDLESGGQTYSWAITPFIEPQWQRQDDRWRVAAGLRLPVSHRRTHFGLLIEAGAIAGGDGDGGLAGFGVSWGPLGIITASIVGRSIITNEGDRFDLSFDVQIPFNLLFRSSGWQP